METQLKPKQYASTFFNVAWVLFFAVQLIGDVSRLNTLKDSFLNSPTVKTAILIGMALAIVLGISAYSQLQPEERKLAPWVRWTIIPLILLSFGLALYNYFGISP